MSQTEETNNAANLIRQKLAGLYKDEPSAGKEIQEAKESEHRSKHQQYIFDLTNSGNSLAEIQTAWHAYYQSLPDNQKHEVWHEFYQEHDRQKSQVQQEAKPSHVVGNPIYQKHHNTEAKAVTYVAPEEPKPPQSVANLKKQLLKKIVSRGQKVSAKEHLKSLGFGLACGFVALIIFLFGFFNERFLAPFITPSKDVSNAPLIIDAGTAAAGPEAQLVIPKINAQLPVVYTVPSIDEDQVETGLESGVLHYATTPNPGEKGNGVIFGHSSNNILNKGKYKFAFSLLRKVQVGDT